MSRTVIINGREYPIENVRVEIVAHGQVLHRIGGPPRPDVGAAARAGIEAARALEPRPRNRHERRALAAKRRKSGLA